MPAFRVPPFRVACLAYVSVALPGSTLGLLWPSMRLSFHQPIGALGAVLAFGVTASVIASALTARILSRVRAGTVVALASLLSALVLAVESLAPSLWVFTSGAVGFGLAFGAIDSALNAYAAGHFGPRQINWMHASYGLGAVIGPVLVTAVLGSGHAWRSAYAIMAVVQVVPALVCIWARQGWEMPRRSRPAALRRPERDAARSTAEAGRRSRVLSALSFTAIETGIESGAGIWGYVFLTAGRGLHPQAAGLAVSAYWATMFAGRVALGPVAERVGTARVLASAVAGVAVGAALMALPGPGFLAVIGLMVVGLAAAPVFPLFTLTTTERVGGLATTRTVSLQVAASALGGAALPAGLGLGIGAIGAKALAPMLLALSLAMVGVYGGRLGVRRVGASQAVSVGPP